MAKRMTMAVAKQFALPELDIMIKTLGDTISDRLSTLRIYLYYDVYMFRGEPRKAYAVEYTNNVNVRRFETLDEAIVEYEKIMERDAVLLAMKAFGISTTGDHS